jgi:hypothetical protein
MKKFIVSVLLATVAVITQAQTPTVDRLTQPALSQMYCYGISAGQITTLTAGPLKSGEITATNGVYTDATGLTFGWLWDKQVPLGKPGNFVVNPIAAPASQAAWTAGQYEPWLATWIGSYLNKAVITPVCSGSV